MTAITATIVLVLLLGSLLALYQSRRRMSRRYRKLILTLHMGTSVGWLGAAIDMTVLLVTALLTQNPDCATPRSPSCTSTTWRS